MKAKRRRSASDSDTAVATDSRLAEALADVVDPELRRPIGQMGMLRGAAVAGRAAQVLIALPSTDWPAAGHVSHSVTEAASSLEGIDDVVVEFTVMDEAEQSALRAQLIGDPAATAGTHDGHGHAEGREVPFAQAGNKTRVLLVASGKGGVGKSSVTVNLAIALAQRGM